MAEELVGPATPGRTAGPGVEPRASHAGGRLRVGLLTTTSQPRWHRKVIADLADSSDTELALVILVDPAAPAGRPGVVDRLYRAVDRRLFRRGPDALDRAEVADLLRGRDSLAILLAEGPESIEEADQDRIRAYDLDVVLALGPEPRGIRSARLARHGVWAYRFGEAGTPDLETVGVRDVLGGRSATVASLVLLGGDPAVGCRPLSTARLRVNRLSARRQGDHVGGIASSIAGRMLRRVRREGSLPPPIEAAPPEVRPTDTPSGVEMAGMIARFGGRLAAEGVRRALFDDQWALAYSTRGAWDGPLPDFSSMRLLLPPTDRFWADPFPIAIGEATYVYFEDYPYSTRKGEISFFEIDDRGRAGKPRTALVRDYHLSYPFVFWWEGRLYMIPETTAVGDVELFRCAGAPDRWEFDRPLIRGVRAADVTLAEHEGLWWLFACIPAEGAHNDLEDLHLFHAESPLGPWRPHQGNPVKSDVGSSRPAGRPYRHDGAWYRPAQDCTMGYGHAIALNRITRWDLGGFEEVEAGRIDPGWAPGVGRTHTFNALDRLFVADARVARPRFLPARKRRGPEP